jgi:regulatory protein
MTNPSVSDFEKSVRRATEAALGLLDVRPRSQCEIERRLMIKGYDESVIAGVVAKLTASGFINDDQFAEQWVESRARAGGLRAMGRRRISQELLAKGVSSERVSAAVSAIGDGDELALAREAAAKKVRLLPTDPATIRSERRKLIGFLQRRGFSWEAVKTVARETLPELDESETLSESDGGANSEQE